MYTTKSAKIVAHHMGRAVLDGDVGIEIEIEGRGLDEIGVKGWHTHREDSLRNGGVEFVTRGPVALGDVFKLVFNLNDSIAKSRARHNLKSHLGSTHIHVNMLGESLDTVLGTAILWTCVEPIVMRLCGPMRDGNLFCLPSYDAGDTQEFVDHLCKYIDTEGRAGRWTHGKYSALNFGRLFDFGTLEFRCFPTSIDPAEIKEWCTWVTNLRKLARSAKDKSFKGAVRHAEQNPEAFVASVFGEGARIALALKPDTVPALVDFGAAQAYELARIVARYRDAPVKEQAMVIVDDVEAVHPAPHKKGLVFGGRVGGAVPDPAAALAELAERERERIAARIRRQRGV